MNQTAEHSGKLIERTALGFSCALLAASAAGALYTGTAGSLFQDFIRLLTTPCPLSQDYFLLGSMPATFLNAGLCGLGMWLFLALLPGNSHANAMAGFFLVIAHAFYGLNFLNIWPCFLAPFLYLRLKKLDLKQYLHINMFATCFGP